MNYEINVSRCGVHYFATHQRSLQVLRAEAVATLRDFKKRFPESEGFHVTMTVTTSYSREVTEADMDSDDIYRQAKEGGY